VPGARGTPAFCQPPGPAWRLQITLASVRYGTAHLVRDRELPSASESIVLVRALLRGDQWRAVLLRPGLVFYRPTIAISCVLRYARMI